MKRFLNRLQILFTASLVLSVSLLFNGCGKGQKTETEQGQIIIHFWQFWTEPRVKAVITKAVEEFEAANPLYKVEITDLTWNDGHQKIVAAFAADRVPDLLELGSDWIAEFAARGALMEMTSECIAVTDSFAGWPPTIYQDRCWALPWYISTRVFYQNDDLARLVQTRDRPHPLIWKDMLQNVRAATVRKPRIWGFGVNAAEPHRLYKRFLPFLWAVGGDILTEDMSACALETESGRRALQFMVELSDGGLVEKQSVLDDQFVAGKLLYHFSGDWLYERLKRSGSDIDYSAFIMPFPEPNQGQRAGFAGGEYLVIPRRASQPVAALNLARHMRTEKNIFNLCIATGCATPANLKVAQNPYFAADSIRVVFMQQLAQAKSPPSHPRWIDIEAALEWGIEQALYKEGSIDEVLSQTCERINKILAEEKKG